MELETSDSSCEEKEQQGLTGGGKEEEGIMKGRHEGKGGEGARAKAPLVKSPAVWKNR